MDLTDVQLIALRNLARKKDGKDVDYINIAVARGLTDLGLAARGQEGWVITEAGAEALRAAGDPGAL